jgi:hypothetical protein
MWMLLTSASVFAQFEDNYNMEVGVLGGLSYCMGEATSYAFQSSTYAFGLQYRYKLNPRIAFQAKAQVTPVYGQKGFTNFDVTAEYNFFRYGLNYYDARVRTLSPYVFLGVGVSVDVITLKPFVAEYAGVYLPVGVGLKWKFAERWQLQAAWQHQVYLDPLEGDAIDGNPYPNPNPNSNILNNDVLSTVMVSVVFEFAQEKKRCIICKEHK